MSNKTQLQTNNTEYASLIEILRGKAIPSGEDVTEETTAYTNTLAELTTAIGELKNDLAGKASGGSGGNIETCTVTINMDDTMFFPYYFCFITVDNSKLSLTWVSTSSVITNVVKNSMSCGFYTEFGRGYEASPPFGTLTTSTLNMYDSEGGAMIIQMQEIPTDTTITCI